jgi:hypothetical protein
MALTLALSADMTETPALVEGGILALAALAAGQGETPALADIPVVAETLALTVLALRQVLHAHFLRSREASRPCSGAQRDRKVQLQIGEEAKREASALKAIAVVTMSF